MRFNRLSKYFGIIVAAITILVGSCFAASYSGGGYGSTSKSSSSKSSSSRSKSSSYSGGGYGSTSKKSTPSTSRSNSGGGYGSSSSKSYGSSASSSPKKSSSSSGGYGSSSSKSYSPTYAPSSSTRSSSSSGSSSSSSRKSSSDYSSSPRRSSSSSDSSDWVVPALILASSVKHASKPQWDDILSTVGRSAVTYTNKVDCDTALRKAIYAHSFAKCPQHPSYIPGFVAIQCSTDLSSSTNVPSSTNSWTNIPVILSGGKWGYTNASGVFSTIDKSSFMITDSHLVKYGYDPNPFTASFGMVVIFALCIIGAFIVIIIVSNNYRRQSY